MIKNFIYKGMAAAGKKPGDDDEVDPDEDPDAKNPDEKNSWWKKRS